MLKDQRHNSFPEHAKPLMHALMYRDLYTKEHSGRVTSLSEELGVACGLSSSELEILKNSAYFHDLGKLGMPDDVLLKPGKLNSEEWQVMKSHAEIGEDIINKLPIDNISDIAKCVRHHHEHYAGSGYPDGLIGEDIPIYSRIISIADSYDAMTVSRPYHRARKHKETMEIIEREQVTKFDPYIFNIFQRLIENNKSRLIE